MSFIITKCTLVIWQKSRIKETANVLRPCLNSETAMAALQDLEAFAANDVNPVQPPVPI